MVIGIWNAFGVWKTHLERGILNYGIGSLRLACGHVCGGIFLIFNCYGRTQPTIGNATPGQLGLTCVRKLAEAARGSEQCSSMVTASGSCLEFLSWLPWVVDYI